MAQLSFLTYLRGIYKLNLGKSGKVHNAVIQSIYDCFVMVNEDIDKSRLEMCLSTATGYWLDCWGEYFAVYRKNEEDDINYSKRIIHTVLSPKSTIPAIKDSIITHLNSTSKNGKTFTEKDVTIFEPWTRLSKYSHKGTLSNDARFFSGDYWCHSVLDISITENITQELIDLVNAVKAAGVKILLKVINSYDIVAGFNTVNDAYSAYQRHLQLQNNRNSSRGFVLSGNNVLSGDKMLSGAKELWFELSSMYYWYAKVLDKQTDNSTTITKMDLVGMLDSYIESEQVINNSLSESSLQVSKNGELSNKKLSGGEATYTTIKTVHKISQELLDNLSLLDSFLSLSYSGKLSSSDGVMVKHTAEHDLFEKLLKELKRLKEENLTYYNSLQSPILNGDRVMWYVQRHKNWLWNTPTLDMEDFYEFWDITNGDGSEPNINNLVEFEDLYYKGYLSFGDKYQPPIVMSSPTQHVTLCYQPWLFDSEVLCYEDLSEIYRRQFKYSLGLVDNPNPTLKDIINLEERYNKEKYSVSGDVQSIIELHSQ